MNYANKIGYNYVDYQLDLALELSIKGNLIDAEKILRKLPSNDPRVIYNLGAYEIKNGNLFKGFTMQEEGRNIKIYGNSPNSNKPLWNGQTNCSILFSCEAGLGDQIAYSRFLTNFAKMGNKIILACDKELMPILKHIDGVSEVVEYKNGAKSKHDFWIPSMSSITMLGLEFDNLSGEPYLLKPKSFIKDDKFKIGIRWAGNPKFAFEEHRKIPPEYFINLCKIPGVSVYSLQKDDEKRKLPPEIKKYPLNTWEQTSGIIASMDLVISSCTSVSHMSAAMGQKTWICPPILPYTLWLNAKNNDLQKTHWYNSVTLFKQEKYGSWEEPFQKIYDKINKGEI